MQNNQSYNSIFDRVIKYQITAECREPMHVGTGDGKKGEILIHPVEERPFIQATGIAGAFREYFKDIELQQELFGGLDGTNSKIRFTDGTFNKASVDTELRPHVSIDRETGTSQVKKIKGNATISGQKFETELVAAGAVFEFQVYIFEKEKSYRDAFEKALEALHCGNIQLGGQKNNGCGYVNLTSVKRAVYTMTDREDRMKWAKEEKDSEDITADIIGHAEEQDERLHFELVGKTDGSVLVKAVSVDEFGEDTVSAKNIVNRKREYIIPATSLKGIIRSQMEKIVQYKDLEKDIIERIFGNCAENVAEGKVGEIKFFDCVIGNTEDNDMVKEQKRIHIDKFTGGTISGQLFSEKPAYGSFKICVDMENESDKAANGLLLLALRDLGLGILPVGGGTNIGHGYLACDSLVIRKGADILAEIDLKAGKIIQGEDVIQEYISLND